MQPSPGTAAAPKAVLPRLSRVQTVGCPLRQGLNWPLSHQRLGCSHSRFPPLS